MPTTKRSGLLEIHGQSVLWLILLFLLLQQNKNLNYGGDSGSTGMLSLRLHVEVPAFLLKPAGTKINADNCEYALAA